MLNLHKKGSKMIQINLEMLDADTTCDICYAEFLEPEDLKVHIDQMHSTDIGLYKKKCQFCIECFTDLETYAYHLRDDHLSTLKCCKYCNRVFSDMDTYRKHESKHYVHVTMSKYSCSNCKMLFTNTIELEQHEYKYHMDSKDGVILHECLPILSSILNIKALSFLQSFGEEVDYFCVSCEYSTKNTADYINHLKKLDCRSLACDMCSSVYRYRTGLARHFFQHPECSHARDKFSTKCPECQKLFDIKMLKEHSRNCKVIKCKSCNIIFDSMYDFSKHQTEKHPSAVLLQTCKYCHKLFAGSKALEKHIARVHAPDLHLYKYVCVYCKDIFKHPKHLFSHFFSTHKDLQPYTCKICDKKFRVRKRFTIHIKLDHKSIGFVEFDDKYHVFFTDKKSEKPFTPPTITEIGLHSKEIYEMRTGTMIENTINQVKESDKINSKKVNFDTEDKGNSEVNLVDSDGRSATDTEIEVKKEHPRKRGRKKTNTRKRGKKPAVESDSSDNETLLNIKKRQKKLHSEKIRKATWNRTKKRDLNDKRKRFICNICKKYCYTFQNYNNHVSLHYKSITKCIKCAQDFRSTEELNEHYANNHSSSQLTETLKNLLEKRKNRNLASELSNAEKFQLTIKKVNVKNVEGTATLKPISDNALSVQKFIESFTPESEIPKKDIVINSNVTIKAVKGVHVPPKITLIKCSMEHTDLESTNLAMPVKFKQVANEEPKATLKIVLTTTEKTEENNVMYEDDNIQSEGAFLDDSETVIPEVAQEVMLEGSEENCNTIQIPHKVIIPKLSAGCKELSIAHMQSEAPFYKIIKVKEVSKSPEPPADQPKKDIKLPDGTKLVSVNPLAHLLGDTPFEKIFNGTRYKYQKPKDFEAAIAMALLKLKKPEKPAKTVKKEKRKAKTKS